MIREFGGKARFVVENHGSSELAKRFGVTRYPAIFVNDVLIATPKDFGFYGKGEGEGQGRYAPIKSAASHERFRADLKRMIELILAGRMEEARARAASVDEKGIAALPAVKFTDLDGRTLSRENLVGKVVLVEIWATWCPPCRPALSWLGEVKKKHGDQIAVISVAVESDEADVRKLASELDVPFHWVMGTPELGRALGDVSAVPTLLVFDREGRAVTTYFGAPPSLHAEAEAQVASLLGK